MSSRIRSASTGAIPRPKKHFTSRAESAAATALDVRCACQFFQSDSLLPERINPIGSRPSSSQGYYSRPISPDLTHHVFEPDYVDPDSHRNFSFGVVGSTDYYSESIPSLLNSTMNSQQNLHLPANIEQHPFNQEVSNLRRDPSPSALLERKGYQKSTETLRQKDPTQSVLLQRRSESTQRNLENIGGQRDPSSSSILRRRFSEKNINNIQQRDPSKSSLLRKRMDSQGSLQPQPSIEEPLAKEPKLTETTPQEPPREPPTNAERFMLSRSTIQTKPPIELSDLYRDTMTFSDLEREEPPEPKTFDVGIIDLMALGTSFIQKGVLKENKKEKKSKRDKENVEETQSNMEDVVYESQELVANTANAQLGYSSPTSSALVHIGQNIYIEEPEESSKESTLPVKMERRSRRDYPDKMNKKPEDREEAPVQMNRELKKTKSEDMEQGTVENVSTTLLPRDVREQSTYSVGSRRVEPEKTTTFKESSPAECIKQRDVSGSSLLRKRYSQNFDDDLADNQTTPSATSIRQRDPSTSDLLRKRYGQSTDDHDFTSTCIGLQNAEEPTSNPVELVDKETVNSENDTDLTDSHSVDVNEEIAKNILLSSTPVFREKMDWIDRTYNTRYAKNREILVESGIRI